MNSISNSIPSIYTPLSPEVKVVDNPSIYFGLICAVADVEMQVFALQTKMMEIVNETMQRSLEENKQMAKEQYLKELRRKEIVHEQIHRGETHWLLEHTPC